MWVSSRISRAWQMRRPQAELAEVEMRRRQVIQAKRVCAVTDGADWLQAFIDLHRPDAVRILDFPQAAEHLAKLLEALEQAGQRFPPQMLERWQARTQASRSAVPVAHGGSPLCRTG